MNLDEIAPILLSLSHADKLRAIQLLARELTPETSVKLDPNMHYEVWSAYDSAGAAQRLSEILDKHKRAKNG